MKEIILILFVAMALSSCNSTRQSTTYTKEQNTKSATPIEYGSIIDEDLGNNGARLLVDIVKLYGYKCDSISSAIRFVFSDSGFTLACNNYRYSYEIEDKGGRWSVKVKR